MEEEKRVFLSAVKQQEKDEFREAVDELVDGIVEDLEKEYHSELESFDAYAQRVREEVHADMAEFRHHFLKGYDVLIEELTQQYNGANTTEDKPPPGAIIL